jgi:hypothetical protein
MQTLLALAAHGVVAASVPGLDTNDRTASVTETAIRR